MAVVDALERVQRPHNSSTKPIEPQLARYNQPIAFLADGGLDSLRALPDIQRLAADLCCQLSVIRLSGSDDSRLAAALTALPGDTPTAVVPDAELDAALAGMSGLVAMLPKRYGPVLRFLLGNSYEQLLRHSSLAVLALPSTGQLPPIRRVLFPADLSPRSQTQFDQTIALCKALDAELHLLHVYGEDRLLPSEQDLARRAATTNPYELMLIDKEQLRALADHAVAHGVRAKVKTAEGRAHTQILAYAAANEIGLISMISHGPRTTEDIWLGSTTARVIQRSPVAVLAMRA